MPPLPVLTLKRGKLHRPVRRRAGLSIIEVTLVMVVLTVAMGLFTSTVNSTSRQRAAKRQAVIASEGARRILEVMRSQNFQQIFALYNNSIVDDPGGPGTAPGPHFSVPGLTAQSGDADGFVGQVRFAWPGPAISEQAVDETLGFPRDISGNDTVDAANHATDYILLPVEVRLQWGGPAGDRSLSVFTAFSNL